MTTAEPEEVLAENLRKIPQQDRAIRRIASIKAAAEQHYAEVGRDRFSTDGVAKIAGCSIGTIYNYFEDKIALLDAIDPDRDALPAKNAQTVSAITKLLAKGLDDAKTVELMKKLLAR